jgi:hypothetical protein
MKLQIDFTAKTIKLEGSENLKEFFNVLKKLFPQNEWQKFSLETQTTIINWSNPIYYHPTPIPNTPVFPWYETISDASGPRKDTIIYQGTYNVVV